MKYPILSTFIFSIIALSSCSYVFNNMEMIRSSSDSMKDSNFRQLSQEQSESLCRTSFEKKQVKTDNNELLRRFAPVRNIKIVRDCSGGVYVLTLDNQGRVLLWQGGQARLITTLSRIPSSVAFSQDGSYLAWSYGKTVTVVALFDLLNTDDKRMLNEYTLNKLTANVTALDFEVGSQAVLIGATDSKVYRWMFNAADTLQGGRIGTGGLDRYHHHASVISSVLCHPAGRLFFSADWNGNLAAWLPYGSDAYGGRYDENLFGTRFFANTPTSKSASRSGSERVDQLKISANGQFILLGTQDGMLELWQVRGLVKLADIAAHTGLMHDVAISPNGKYLISIARDGVLKIWQVQTKKMRRKEYEFKLLHEINDYDTRVLAFVDDDRFVAAGVLGQVSWYSVSELLKTEHGLE